jgi:hypothetical protein
MLCTPARPAAPLAAIAALLALASSPSEAQVRNESQYPFVQGAPAGDADARPGERPGAFRRDDDYRCEVRIITSADGERVEIRRCR